MALSVTSRPADACFGNNVRIIECSDIRDVPYDLYVKCGLTTFVVHKAVACAACPILGDLLKECRPDYMWQLDFGVFSPDVTETFLHYIYHKQVSVFQNLSSDVLLGLLKVTQWLRMTSEVGAIFRVLLKTNDRAVVYQAWDLAQEFQNKVVKQLVIQCIYDNLAHLVESHFFIQVRWDLIKALLASPSSQKTPNIHLVDAVIQWVRWDLESKQENLVYIAQHINWKKLDHQDIIKRFEMEPLVRTLMEISEDTKLKSSVRTVCVGKREELPPELPRAFKPVPKMTSDILQYSFKHGILLVGRDSKTNFIVQVYHPHTDLWTVKVDVQMPFFCHYSSTFVKKRLYIIGGGVGDNYKYVKCFAYDIPRNQPFEFEDLNFPRTHTGTTSDESFIYVVGGLDLNGAPTKKVEKLDVTGSIIFPPAWVELPSMKWERWHPGVVVDSTGNIFVIGGHTSSCELFDKAKIKWCKMPSLPMRYRNVGMLSTFCKNCIYSFRRCEPREVCICDPAKNTMKVIPVGGNVPKEIIAIVYCNYKIWALAESKQFYVYMLPQCTWKCSQVKAPEEMVAVFNAIQVRKSDVGLLLQE